MLLLNVQLLLFGSPSTVARLSENLLCLQSENEARRRQKAEGSIMQSESDLDTFRMDARGAENKGVYGFSRKYLPLRYYHGSDLVDAKSRLMVSTCTSEGSEAL